MSRDRKAKASLKLGHGKDARARLALGTGLRKEKNPAIVEAQLFHVNETPISETPIGEESAHEAWTLWVKAPTGNKELHGGGIVTRSQANPAVKLMSLLDPFHV